MNLTHAIRLLCEAAFERQSKTPGHPPAPYMQSFLAVPLKERMTLLALYDGRTMEEIKAAFPWVKETDVRLKSARIQDAAAILCLSFEDPTAWMNPGPYPEDETGDLVDPTTPLPVSTREIPATIETQLRQALFTSVPVMLFGTHVPKEIAQLGLRKRAIVYLVVVEEMPWGEVMSLMECSKRQIHNSLTGMVRALGG
jgi:hypothetical protein